MITVKVKAKTKPANSQQRFGSLTGLIRQIDPAVSPKVVGPAQAYRPAADQAMLRYAQGDDKAFADLYDALAQPLYRYLLRQTRDRGRAEDLLQQTMLQLHRSRGRFVGGGDVTPWAFAIARRLLIDSIRRQKSEGKAIAFLSSLDQQLGPASDDLLHSKRAAEALERQLLLLPEGQRQMFKLIKQDGWSLREAADA